jgi:hypothetical protein
VSSGSSKGCAVEGPLVVAVQVVAVADAKDVAVAGVEEGPVGHLLVVAFAALDAVDDVGDDAVARKPPRGLVGGRGGPLLGGHVVARRLGRLRRHPEPDGRLEGDDGVRRHQLRVAQQVLGDGRVLPGRPVVVVVGELDGPAAEVLLAGDARPLGVLARHVAVVGGGAVLLLVAVAPGEGAVGRVRPAARGLMPRLPQERGELALLDLRAARGAEARERVRRRDEGVVRVEAPSFAVRFVAVLQHPLEEIFCDNGRHATAARGARGGGGGGRGRRGRGAAPAAAVALTLAAVSAVVGGGATVAPLAAAEAVRAELPVGAIAALRSSSGHGERRGQHGRKCQCSHHGLCWLLLRATSGARACPLIYSIGNRLQRRSRLARWRVSYTCLFGYPVLEEMCVSVWAPLLSCRSIRVRVESIYYNPFSMQ